jgi:hypothetical protein
MFIEYINNIKKSKLFIFYYFMHQCWHFVPFNKSNFDVVIFRRQLQQFQKSFAKHPFNFSTHFPHLVLNYHPVPHADKVFA